MVVIKGGNNMKHFIFFMLYSLFFFFVGYFIAKTTPQKEKILYDQELLVDWNSYKNYIIIENLKSKKYRILLKGNWEVFYYEGNRQK